LPRPILALIGSDHPVMRAQLDRVHDRHVTLPGNLPVGDVAVTVGLPPDLPRRVAVERIARTFAGLLRRIERPGTLLVSGGETLRALCDALGGSRLDVDGELEPGVPTSILRGGAWDGQRVVSKSGAFGAPDFLVRLLGSA
jgi:hypothetical protein